MPPKSVEYNYVLILFLCMIAPSFTALTNYAECFAKSDSIIFGMRCFAPLPNTIRGNVSELVNPCGTGSIAVLDDPRLMDALKNISLGVGSGQYFISLYQAAQHRGVAGEETLGWYWHYSDGTKILAKDVGGPLWDVGHPSQTDPKWCATYYDVGLLRSRHFYQFVKPICQFPPSQPPLGKEMFNPGAECLVSCSGDTYRLCHYIEC